jgi:endonuclease/exonuclease/phosphatase family metal-dependent hydrolase
VDDRTTPQPLTLLRRNNSHPTWGDVLRLPGGALNRWIAEVAQPNCAEQHDFIDGLRLQTRATEICRLHAATWNVGALPPIFGSVASPLARSSPARFAEIGRQLAQSPYDVVALQELWDSPSAEILKHARFPFMAPKCFTPGLLGKSGLAIISRHPIVSVEERPFSNRVGVERFVRKGMLRALIELEDQQRCYVYTAHALSPPEPATRQLLSEERACRVRIRQFDELAAFMRSGDPTIPTIVLGDFNCQSGDKDYAHLSSILHNDIDRERWRWDPSPRPTFDIEKNRWARGYHAVSGALDHIWVPCRNNEDLVIHSSRGQMTPDRSGYHLSDHYLLEAKVTWFHGDKSRDNTTVSRSPCDRSVAPYLPVNALIQGAIPRPLV